MESLKTGKYLGEEKISKLLLKFSVPCILSLLVSSLYNIVDQIFIGNSELGYLGNAATTIVFPITIISVAFAWCFGDGAAAYLSISQGKKDTKHAHQSIGNAMAATFIISLIFILVCSISMDKILFTFGASQASIGLARDYFVIILIGIPAFMLMNMMSAVIRADGSPGFSMVTMLAGAIINIVLDPIFIFVFKWGIKGAAYATIIGQIVSFVIAASYFFRSKTFKLTRNSFILNLKVFSTVIQLGISTFITQMSIVVISLVCNIMLVKYGTISEYGQDIPIAVIGIAMKVFTIVINIVVGIILGGQPILGYNYGAKNYKRVKETFKLVFVATAVVGIIATLVFELCPQVIIGMFGSESVLYNEFAQMTFRIFLSLVVFTCIIKMTAIFFQAVGQPLKSAIISLARDIVFFVPLVILIPKAMGIKGILWAAPIADIAGMVVTAIFIRVFFKSLDKEDAKLADKSTNDFTIKPSKPGVIITIAREHGSAGKYIGQLVGEKLNMPYYYKEMTALAAQESGLSNEFISEINEHSPKILYDLYVSSAPMQYAMIAQEKIIRKIADNGSCIIVGRSADYILREYEDIVRIFIYAPKDYRIKKVMEIYGDTEQEGENSIEKSDKARSAYHKNMSGLDWGNARNYDLCIDSSIGTEKTANIICAYLANLA